MKKKKKKKKKKEKESKTCLPAKDAVGNIAFLRDVTSVRAYVTFVLRSNTCLSLHSILN